jgi:hypothetical protein
MHGFSHVEGRTIRVDGTKGTIIGAFLASGSTITVYDHLKGTETLVYDSKADTDPNDGHGGGDTGIMKSFIDFILYKSKSDSLTSANASLESHILAFAAEESRLNNSVIDLQQYRKRNS